MAVFDLQGGWPVVAARVITVSALLSTFGSLTFRVIVAPQVFARLAAAEAVRARRRLQWTTQLGMAAGVLGVTAWLILQSADLAAACSVAETLAALPKVLRDTLFGHLILGELFALALLAVVIGRRDDPVRQRAGLAVATAALALQAGHSHAYSMYGGVSVLLGVEILHLLAAGAWLGGLVPLVLLVAGMPPVAGAVAARRFSPMGKWCVVTMIVSSTVQGWVLVASLRGLFGTAYGWLVLLKLALFVVLLGFALANRYRFAPALLGGCPAAARRTLVRSIVLQTGFAIAVVLAAGVLSALPPSMHDQRAMSRGMAM